MNNRQLIYLVYGDNPAYAMEARFSILSACYHQRRTGGSGQLDIVVYTDRPGEFNAFPVKVEEIGKTDLEAWYGKDNYNHRAKICALQRALPAAGKTVFIDTDTLFLQSPLDLFELVADDTVLFDTIYSHWQPFADPSFSGIDDYLVGQGIGYKGMPLCNSGITGIARTSASVADQALDLVDALYTRSERLFTVEQIALSVAANMHGNVVAQSGVVKHYWNRKKLYRGKIAAFFEKHVDSGFSDAMLADVPLIRPVKLRPNTLQRFFYKNRARRAPGGLRQFFVELLYGTHRYRNEFEDRARQVWFEVAVENLLERDKARGTDLREILESGYAAKILGRREQGRIIDCLSSYVAGVNNEAGGET